MYSEPMSDMAVEKLPGQWRRPNSSDNVHVSTSTAAATPPYAKSGDSPFPCSTSRVLLLSETKQAPCVTVAQSSDRESQKKSEMRTGETKQNVHDIESARAATPKDETCSRAEDESKISASTSEAPSRRSSRKPTPSETVRNKSEPRDGDITLSFNDGRYKEIMWRHYNILGKRQFREKQREETVVQQILQSLKTRLGMGGRFFRRMYQSDLSIVVDDEEALQSKNS